MEEGGSGESGLPKLWERRPTSERREAAVVASGSVECRIVRKMSGVDRRESKREDSDRRVGTEGTGFGIGVGVVEKAVFKRASKIIL